MKLYHFYPITSLFLLYVLDRGLKLTPIYIDWMGNLQDALHSLNLPLCYHFNYSLHTKMVLQLWFQMKLKRLASFHSIYSPHHNLTQNILSTIFLFTDRLARNVLFFFQYNLPSSINLSQKLTLEGTILYHRLNVQLHLVGFQTERILLHSLIC